MKGILIAVILDLIIGDPYSFPHPVKLMGRLISLEEKLVREINWGRQGRISNLKIGGLLIVISNIILAFTIPYLLLKTIEEYKVLHSIINIYLIYTCIAARSLDKEAMKVYYGLDKGIEEARYKLSYIVGRDTKNLSEEEVIRAAIETVGENTADGVIAPLFYIMLLGAPGGLMYKMVNTMDSMLGYKNEKYMELGFFPAKVDDVYNYIPARLTGVLMCLSSIFRFNVKNGFRIMIRDRKNHKSPNAAYPEGAVAGLLNIQLGGNSYYFGKIVEKPTIGDRIRNIHRQDIKKTIEIMYRTEVLLLVIYGLINILLGR
ncbi:adenosylcobinamide-phosphate synthase CbiB [Clostridium sp. Cult1]|uniref:adenosylcobinamide-phosphate synthase CbiB n=1 Tax=Clostridium sp. Cult1 TaxID=2079002 RepID=UPI001F0305A0|nr:adenosylcobinamide-phosphate synthase CbiB [Clostridium sp. Cult1]MCF6462888.1 cobalamin biosynthesis protein CobD [Clostridium sp. Cult1]